MILRISLYQGEISNFVQMQIVPIQFTKKGKVDRHIHSVSWMASNPKDHSLLQTVFSVFQQFVGYRLREAGLSDDQDEGYMI